MDRFALDLCNFDHFGYAGQLFPQATAETINFQ